MQKDKNTLLDPLRMYFEEVRKAKLLDVEEEWCLVLLKESGELEARSVLIESNLRLALQLALEFHRSYGGSIPDLIGKANEALIEAIDRFESKFNTRISTYATIIIRQRLIELIQEDSVIYVPASAYYRWKNVNTTSRKLQMELGRKPSSVEIAQRMKTTPEVIEELFLEMRRKKVLCLDRPLKHEKDEPLGYFIEDHNFSGSNPEEQLEAAEVKELLEVALSKVKEICSEPTLLEQNKFVFRDVTIFTHRYGLNNGMVPLKLEEVGLRFGLSKERVRQISKWVWEEIKKILPDNEYSLIYTLLNVDVDPRGKPPKNKEVKTKA